LTDALDPHKDAMQAALAQTLDAFTARLQAAAKANAAAAAAPASAAAPAAPAAPAQVSALDVVMDKVYAYDPFQADPEPALMGLLTMGQGMLVKEIRDRLSQGASFDERQELAEKWQRAKAEGRDCVEATVRGQFEQRLAERQAAEQARAEVAETQRYWRERDLRELGEQAGRLVGGGLFAEAAEAGALAESESVLQKHGWSQGALARLAEVKQRVVEVDADKIAGRGYQVVERDGKTLAYVPAHQDVPSFIDNYGPGQSEAESQGDLNEWRMVPNGEGIVE
jgi:hypothetical protein